MFPAGKTIVAGIDAEPGTAAPSSAGTWEGPSRSRPPGDDRIGRGIPLPGSGVPDALPTLGDIVDGVGAGHSAVVAVQGNPIAPDEARSSRVILPPRVNACLLVGISVTVLVPLKLALKPIDWSTVTRFSPDVSARKCPSGSCSWLRLRHHRGVELEREAREDRRADGFAFAKFVRVDHGRAHDVRRAGAPTCWTLIDTVARLLLSGEPENVPLSVTLYWNESGPKYPVAGV